MRATPDGAPAEARRLLWVALAALVAFGAFYVLAVLTEVGQRGDSAALAVSESAPEVTRDSANELLGLVSTGSLLLAGLFLGAVILLRGQPKLVLVPLAIIGTSLVATELLKLWILPGLLPRPDFIVDPLITDASFPSGHTSVGASLALAAIVAAPSRLRGLVALAGFALAAGSGVLVVIATWHRPSDAIGSFAITLACTAALLALLYAWRPELVGPRSRGGEPGAGFARRIEVLAVAAGIGLFALAIVVATLRYGSQIDWSKPDAAFLLSLSGIVAGAGLMVGALMRALGISSPEVTSSERDRPPTGRRSGSDTVVGSEANAI